MWSHCQPSETARLALGCFGLIGLQLTGYPIHLGGFSSAAACRVQYSSREPVTPCHGTQGPYTSLFCNAASTVGQISLTVAACGEQMGMCARLGDANWMADQAKIPSTDRAWTTRVFILFGSLLQQNYSTLKGWNQWPVRLTNKPWLEVLLVDLLWEKNTIRWLKKYGL